MLNLFQHLLQKKRDPETPEASGQGDVKRLIIIINKPHRFSKPVRFLFPVSLSRDRDFRFLVNLLDTPNNINAVF